MLVAKWWEVYNDESLDFKADQNPAAVAGEEQTFSKSSIMASMSHEPPISYIPAPTAAWNIIYLEWLILIVRKLVWSVLIICFSLFCLILHYDILFFGLLGLYYLGPQSTFTKTPYLAIYIYTWYYLFGKRKYNNCNQKKKKGSIITFVLVYWRSLIMYQNFT